MLTQQVIGEHLGISRQAVAKDLKKMGIVNWQNMTLDQVRLEYLDRLRKFAAGHQAPGTNISLVEARIRRELVETELAKLKLNKEQGLLIDAAELYPELQSLFQGMKIRVIGLADQLKPELDAIHGINIDGEWLMGKCEGVLIDCIKYIESHCKALEGSVNGADTASKVVDNTMG